MQPTEFRRNVDQNVVCHYSINPSRDILNFTQLQDYVKKDLCASYTVPSAVRKFKKSVFKIIIYIFKSWVVVFLESWLRLQNQFLATQH